MMKRSFVYAWPFLTSLTLLFVITFVIFPGAFFATSFKFIADMGLNPSLIFPWSSLLYIGTFNLMDTIGRYMGGWKYTFIGDKATFGLNFSRLIYIATTIMLAW